MLLLLFSFGSSRLAAQSCFNINAGNDTSVSCLQSCLNLHARVPDIRTTDTYQVVPIAYNPYPYTTAGGTTDPLVYADDHFSDSFLLPFPFCFYGNTYRSLTVGSNGVLTFDSPTNANTLEGYVINPGDSIPFAGSAPNVQGTYYAPRASIFLAYVDFNPVTSPPERKIEWRLEGVAPCRRFVVSYYHVGNYDVGNCPNATNLCTMQAVLYEGTGVIDVFYENKPVCQAYQGGLAIAGVQNWGQDQAVSPPGTNGTIWTASNTGYRYVPSGSGSLLNRVELYKNNVLISTATTTSLGNGELDALFSNICQSEDSMTYVVRAFYKQCDNPAIETEGSDSMIVYKTLNPLITNISNVLCRGTATGKITVTSPVDPTVEYSIDGGTTWQASNVFTVPAGNYTILARVISTTCGGSTNVVVTEPAAVLGSFTSSTPASCRNNDGSITITTNGGTPVYAYSIDGGVSYVVGNVFLDLPVGLYNIKVKDANGCTNTLTETVLLDDTMRLELGPDSTICFGSSLTLMPQTNLLTDTFKWRPAATLNYDTVMNPVATPLDTTLYILTAKWGICQRTDSVTVNVLHKPVAHAGKDTIICYKSFALLNGSATNLSGPVTYAWTPSTNVVPPNFPIALAKPDSTQLYILTVKDNYGCNFTVSDSILVIMEAPVPAFAGNDTNALLGKPHQLFATGGVSYRWSPSAPLNNPFVQNPQAILYTDTYFRVLVTDAIGCTATDDVFLKVYDGPNYYVPNAFSPNGDGLNEIFRPIPVGISVTDYFIVYNRLGEPVFQTNQWLKGWDGRIKGKEASSGTYAWVIKGRDKNGRVVEMQGTVVLIR